jgi:hypothetical protein
MQTQFCCIHGEEYYNFYYTHMVQFWIFLAWQIGVRKT